MYNVYESSLNQTDINWHVSPTALQNTDRHGHNVFTKKHLDDIRWIWLPFRPIGMPDIAPFCLTIIESMKRIFETSADMINNVGCVYTSATCFPPNHGEMCVYVYVSLYRQTYLPTYYLATDRPTSWLLQT